MSTPIPFTVAQVRQAFPGMYVHESPLGRGSFKIAFLVERDEVFSVLKIFHAFSSDADPDAFEISGMPERVRREIDAMAQVQHPNLVQIVTTPSLVQISNENYVYYEEKYYSGGTLEARLERGALSSVELEDLLVALLGAANALWESDRIVHRDIKPANIAYDAENSPVLLDLGIAYHAKMDALTDTGDRSPRTPLYAAPEQFAYRRDVSIDQRTDQYAIGLTVLEASCGHHPILNGRTDINEDEYRELMEEFDPSPFLPADATTAFRETVARLISFEPHRRFRRTRTAIENMEAK